MSVDRRRLAVDLMNEVDGEVRFDDGERALYATDASNYRQLPLGVVLPRSAEGVVAALDVCRRHGAPIVNRGGGTGLAGQTCNEAVVLDMSRHYNRLLELNPEERTAVVEPGIVLDDLRDAAEQHGLTFGPDPATHDHCTLGGMLGNNSCGVHSVMAGRTVDNVVSMEVVTADGTRLEVGPTNDGRLAELAGQEGRMGEIYRRLRDLRDRHADAIRSGMPDIPRRVSGYGLEWLLPERGFDLARALVGTESTCVTILRATLQLVPSPPHRSLLVLGYPDVFKAADAVTDVMESGPIGLEGLDDALIRDMKEKGLHPQDAQLLPDGRGWLIVEYGADSRDEADAKAKALMDRLKDRDDAPSMKLYDDPDEEAKVWEVRESGLGATAMVPGKPDTWPGWEDAAVPPASLGRYLRQFRELLDKHDLDADLYGHFGQGCVHCRINFDLTSASGIANYRAFVTDAAHLVTSHGGSLSGEHGDGQSRGELLPIMYGPELMNAFGEFKRIWDPDGLMNPGKVVDARPIDENLRLGTDYAPRQVATHFAYPEDDNSFARATLRCVGVGKCRREDGGTMCPSYMVTREEQHSTRGRAHLLWEMLNGRELQGDGWRSEPVREALDLCLACKGCKGDCPVNVDMATYKAEFLSHYYEGRLRPRSAYAFGLIYWWAGLASKAPRLVNWAAHAPVLSGIGKRLAGLAPERDIPRFASRTFRATHQPTPDGGDDRREVILWPDTFNNHFHPGTLEAAQRVLEDAGFRVTIPRATLCCGRPLYDFGMLDLAKRLLRQVMRELRPQIRAGVPVIGLEPSCVSVFRDELLNFWPQRADAKRLHDQTYTLAGFLAEHAPDWKPAHMEGGGILHGHCHHKSVLDMDAERELLGHTDLDLREPDSGCCGMAGAFGFEAEHYDVSVAAGERVLLPAVRNAGDGEIVITDGFSCREQVRQLSGRRALHTAEVLAQGLEAR